MLSATTVVLTIVFVVLAVSCYLQIFYALKVVPIFDNVPPLKGENYSPLDWTQLVSIVHPRGYTLRGSFFAQQTKASRGLILFVPEFQAIHDSAWKYCQGLYEEGYAVLSVNFTGQGERDADPEYRPRFWVGQREVEDLQVILAEIQNRAEWASEFIGIYGISRGAATALAVVSRRPDVPALITEGAYANRQIIERAVRSWMTFVLPHILCRTIPFWHIIKTVEFAQLIYQLKTGYWFCDPRRFPRSQKTRVLLISGAKDKYVPAHFATELVPRYGIQNATLRIIDNANHNQARAIDPVAYDQILVSFFSSNGVPVASTPDTNRAVEPTSAI